MSAHEATPSLVVAAPTELRVRCERVEGEITGYVLDPSDLSRRFVVEFFLDGQSFAVARAQLRVPSLSEEGIADGCFGFAFALPDELAEAGEASVRIANTDIAVGEPIQLADPPLKSGALRVGGEVEWAGGLRLTGWVELDPDRQERHVLAFIDGECVARTRLDAWTHRGEAMRVRPVLAFELFLPTRFADGRVHKAVVADEEGRDLGGSPCAIVAFEDALEPLFERSWALKSERLRGRLYDRLFPRSAPFEDFSEWSRRFPLAAVDAEPRVSLAVTLLGEKSVEASLASLELSRGCEWVAGVFAERSRSIEFDPREIENFLAGEAGHCPFVAVARAGTVFEPTLARLAGALIENPEAPIAYSDIAIQTDDGGSWPIAFSAFDYERALEQGYATSLFVMRSQVALAAVQAGATNAYRLFNYCLDQWRDAARALNPNVARSSPVHVPAILAEVPAIDIAVGSSRLASATEEHLRAVGAKATIDETPGGLFPALRVRGRPAVRSLSIIMPAYGRGEALRRRATRAAAAIEGSEGEVLIVGDEDVSGEIMSFGRRVRYVRTRGRNFFANGVNSSVPYAAGDLLLFLGPHVEPPDRESLEEMLRRISEADVGAVGPVLVDPSGRVRNAGATLGVDFAVCEAFAGRDEMDPGYGDLLLVAHEVSAVWGGAMLTPRRLFHDLKGFDVGSFPRRFADVDYCLRLRALGFRIIVAPRARMLTEKDAGWGTAVSMETDGQDQDLAALRRRWGETLMNDPSYSPWLALTTPPYNALAWPPRHAAPRFPSIARPRDVPTGL